MKLVFADLHSSSHATSQWMQQRQQGIVEQDWQEKQTPSLQAEVPCMLQTFGSKQLWATELAVHFSLGM